MAVTLENLPFRPWVETGLMGGEDPTAATEDDAQVAPPPQLTISMHEGHGTAEMLVYLPPDADDSDNDAAGMIAGQLQISVPDSSQNDDPDGDGGGFGAGAANEVDELADKLEAIGLPFEVER